MVGGEMFTTKDGTLITVSSLDGTFKVYTTLLSKPAKMGGNYYVGQDNHLYTTDNVGDLVDTKGFIVDHGVLPGTPLIYGYSYIIYTDGTFSMVGGDGSVHNEAVWLSTTGSSLKIIKKIDPKTIDLTSVYLPGKGN